MEIISMKGKVTIMSHIKTINKANLKETAAKGGCGKCQTSCQSACNNIEPRLNKIKLKRGFLLYKIIMCE